MTSLNTLLKGGSSVSWSTHSRLFVPLSGPCLYHWPHSPHITRPLCLVPSALGPFMSLTPLPMPFPQVDRLQTFLLASTSPWPIHRKNPPHRTDQPYIVGFSAIPHHLHSPLYPGVVFLSTTDRPLFVFIGISPARSLWLEFELPWVVCFAILC